MSTKKLICHHCSSDFEIPMKEFNRQTKKGRTHFFCGLSCSCAYGNTNRIINPETLEKHRQNAIRTQFGKRHGKFGWYVSKSKARKYESNMTEEYLETIWNGKCAITDIDIVLRSWSDKCTPYTASLDRIDSSKGYIEGNVQFVSYSVNVGKMQFTNEEMISFFNNIKSIDPK